VPIRIISPSRQPFAGRLESVTAAEHLRQVHEGRLETDSVKCPGKFGNTFQSILTLIIYR
jgi:hypothetical protein